MHAHTPNMSHRLKLQSKPVSKVYTFFSSFSIQTPTSCVYVYAGYRCEQPGGFQLICMSESYGVLLA